MKCEIWSTNFLPHVRTSLWFMPDVATKLDMVIKTDKAIKMLLNCERLSLFSTARTDVYPKEFRQPFWSGHAQLWFQLSAV